MRAKLPYLQGLSVWLPGLLLLWVGISAASDPEQVGEAAYVDLPCDWVYVRSLTIKRENVFGVQERYAETFYGRLANCLHVTTREGVIRRGLRFAPGDRVCRNDFEAAIRRLRAYQFLHGNIDIDLHVEGDSADVTVKTRDTWTTRPALAFSKEGSLLTWSVSLEEQNLFGLGKGLGGKLAHEEPHDYWGIWYRDPQLAGSDIFLRISTFEGEDLRSRKIDLLRGYSQTTTPWGLNLQGRWHNSLYIDRRGGLEGPEWEWQHRLLLVTGGPRVAGSGPWALRLKPALSIMSDRFAPRAGEALYPGTGLAAREIRSLGLEVDYVYERFSQRSGIDRFDRREDFNLGTDLQAQVGYSAESMGADADGLYLSVVGSQGLSLGPRRFAQAHFVCTGQIIDACAENLRITSALRYYDNLTARHTIATRLGFSYGVNLYPQSIFTMGASSGLRGFEAYRFWGERRMIYNLEDRITVLRDLLGLLTVGVTLFADGGLTWEAGEPERARPRAGAGIGLRLLGTRTRGALVSRIDLGFPVLGGDEEDGAVLSISAGQVF